MRWMVGEAHGYQWDMGSSFQARAKEGRGGLVGPWEAQMCCSAQGLCDTGQETVSLGFTSHLYSELRRCARL